MPSVTLSKGQETVFNEARRCLATKSLLSTTGLSRATGIARQTLDNGRDRLVRQNLLGLGNRSMMGYEVLWVGDSQRVEQHIIPNQINPEDVYPANDREMELARLEAENQELRRKLEWLAHTKASEFKGGTFTLNSSDYHLHDRGHLISSFRSLVGKVQMLLDQYQPRHFNILVNGDTVPGRGIFRNQALESVLAKTEHQIHAATYRLIEMDEEFKKDGFHPKWHIVQGNHDWSEGEPTAMKLAFTMKLLGVDTVYIGNQYVLNLADSGFYNVWVEHGYGNSRNNPTSDHMVAETMKKLHTLSTRGYYGEKQIRRVLHGHTHYLQSGAEKTQDLPFDTTGGLHRNDRANIGMNTRPTGWIVYVSPPGTDDILTPIELKPDREALYKDLDDPMLENKNRAEAARCLAGFEALATEKGLIDTLPVGT